MLSFSVLRGETGRGCSDCLLCWWLWGCHGKAGDLRGVCVVVGREPACSDLLQLCEWASRAELYPSVAIPRQEQQQQQKKKDEPSLTSRGAVHFAEADCIKYRRCKKILCYFPYFFPSLFFGRMCPLSSKDWIQSSANNEISSNPPGSRQGSLIGCICTERSI